VLLQILAVRRSAAARQGLLVDLTTEAPEAELAAAQAELEALERAEDEAQRAAAAANKRKALEDALVSMCEVVLQLCEGKLSNLVVLARGWGWHLVVDARWGGG
jgi:hypothetical protein